MKKIVYTGVSVLLLSSSLLLLNCKEDKKNVVSPIKIEFKKEGELSIYRSQDSLLSKFDIEIAEDEYERQTGLMNRTSMEDSQGMLFIFPDENYRSFYMKNTQISLDIIYINSENKVVSFQKNAKPFDESSLPSTAPAKYVFEINAGLSDRLGIKEGDSISFQRK